METRTKGRQERRNQEDDDGEQDRWIEKRLQERFEIKEKKERREPDSIKEGKRESEMEFCFSINEKCLRCQASCVRMDPQQK